MGSGSWMIHSRYSFRAGRQASGWDSSWSQVNLGWKLCIWIQLICKVMDTYSAQMMACYWSAQWIINTQVNTSWQPCRLRLLFQSQKLEATHVRGSYKRLPKTKQTVYVTLLKMHKRALLLVCEVSGLSRLLGLRNIYWIFTIYSQ